MAQVDRQGIGALTALRQFVERSGPEPIGGPLPALPLVLGELKRSTDTKVSGRGAQGETAKDPGKGKYRWRHARHGFVMANTKSEARARFLERGPLGEYPVERAK